MSGARQQAAAQLLALIDELRRTAEAAQATNVTYRNYIQAQALRIATLETDLRIATLELEAARRPR
jgi:hypothetical protein